MEVIKLLIGKENSQKICFLCFKEYEENINIDDSMEIYDEKSHDSTSLRNISNYLFPFYDIIAHHSCEYCTKLMIKMYTTISRGLTKIKMIHQLTEKIYNEIESKSVLVRNKMTINLQGEETERIKTDLASRDGLEYNVEIKAEENHGIIKNNSDNTLICEICGNSYKSPTMLKTHLKSHTEAQCSLCQKVLKSSNLKTHLRKHTKPTNVYSVFKCNECDYKTGNKEDLKSHMYKTHMKIRPFICKICHKAFYSNKNLIEHCSTHNRDKNMVCDICGERFSYRKTLAYHMRSHLNQRSFICDVCGYIFLTISRRNEHVKRKHGPKQFCCNLCDKKYSLRKEINRHMKNKHDIK